MKRITLFFFSLMATVTLLGQDIAGQWNGILKVQGSQLRIVFNVSKTDSGYVTTMDSPDQGAKGIPVSFTSFENSVLKIEAATIGMRYEGTQTQEDLIVGEFRQLAFSSPLTLTKSIPEKERATRPQDPTAPLPYVTEEVTFSNSIDNAILAGTLSLPEKTGKFPAVVLITGSGAQNRDEELMGHRPFLVLADHLTRNGIAVLRYDDRGTAQSTGDFLKATTKTFATDVDAAVRYLLTRKEIDKKKIGLIGHSEGGSIAPMVAAENKDIRFIVLMAGPGLRGEELLLLQGKLLAKAAGQSEEQIARNTSINKGAYEIIVNATDQERMKKELQAYLIKSVAEMPAEEKPSGIDDDLFVQQQVNQITSPWFQEFLKYDPTLILRKVHCPVLALNGAKDLQVPPRENLTAIKSNLEKGGNDEVTVREYPNLNHLFQECTTGLPKEYGEIEQTIAPQVLNEISDWILRKTK